MWESITVEADCKAMVTKKATFKFDPHADPDAIAKAIGCSLRQLAADGWAIGEQIEGMVIYSVSKTDTSTSAKVEPAKISSEVEAALRETVAQIRQCAAPDSGRTANELVTYVGGAHELLRLLRDMHCWET
jgi:hypothetical protein